MKLKLVIFFRILLSVAFLTLIGTAVEHFFPTQGIVPGIASYSTLFFMLIVGYFSVPKANRPEIKVGTVGGIGFIFMLLYRSLSFVNDFITDPMLYNQAVKTGTLPLFAFAIIGGSIVGTIMIIIGYGLAKKKS